MNMHDSRNMKFSLYSVLAIPDYTTIETKNAL